MEGSMEMSSSSNGGDHGAGSKSASLGSGADTLLGLEILLTEVTRLSNCLSAIARAVAHLCRHFETFVELEEVTGGADSAEG